MLSGPVGQPSAFHYDAESLCMSVFAMDEDPKWNEKSKLVLAAQVDNFRVAKIPISQLSDYPLAYLVVLASAKSGLEGKGNFSLLLPARLVSSHNFSLFSFSCLRFRRTNFFATQLFTHIRLIPFEQFRL